MEKKNKKLYKSTNSYSQNADDTIRKFALPVPVIFFTYGLLIRLGYIPSDNDFGWGIFLFITAGFILLGIHQAVYRTKTALVSMLRLGADHILAVLVCIFISTDLLVIWPILMLANYIYFGMKGLKINLVAFASIFIIDISLHISNTPYILKNIMIFTAITLSGLAVIFVSRTREIKQKELYESRIRESLQRDRVAAIVNNLTDAIISTDINGIIRVYNAASLSLLDTNSNLVGKHIDKVLPLIDTKNNPISVLDEFKKLKSVVQRDDLCYRYNKDETIRLAVTYTPIRKGYSNTRKSEIHDGFIIIMRDITKDKSLEEERDEFISVISHELRTPITTAEGTISNIQYVMKRPETTLKLIEEPINVAHEQIMFLANIVNDLSALSRAERGLMGDEEDIDILGLITTQNDKYTPEAEEKGLKLKLQLDPNLGIIHSSKLYIEEIIQNLLTNAIKYTNEGEITIIVNKKDKNIYFAVKDTGIGISKSDQQRVFDKFYRSEDFRTRETGGTGLGLNIAMKLAHQLGTEIKISSQLNHGSTFSFSLPITKSPSDKAK